MPWCVPKPECVPAEDHYQGTFQLTDLFVDRAEGFVEPAVAPRNLTDFKKTRNRRKSY